ncbi:MAG TPA: hypothetical protein VF160_13660 [Candidatus Dormibacteraeota bacterium]
MAASDTSTRTWRALRTLVERVTPWLLDLGAWILGALVAFDLVMLGALLTVGPVDRAALVGTLGFALALPPAVAGFLLLRLGADMKTVSLEAVATSAFKEAGFTAEGGRASGRRRRADVILRYSYGLLAAALLLTLAGLTAALWHMAWWIAVLFVVTAAASQVVVLRAVMGTGSDQVWRSPAGEAEPEPRS